MLEKPSSDLAMNGGMFSIDGWAEGHVCQQDLQHDDRGLVAVGNAGIVLTICWLLHAPSVR